ncbi:DUF3857 domain-containing protein [bacterium]|nr:DUF3857 domain-containing protein [bacterium]
MRIYTTAILFCFLIFSAFAQHVSKRDVIYTTDGEEFRGELGAIDSDSIVFKTISGEKTFARSEVIRVELAKERPGDWWLTAEEIDDPILNDVLANLPNPEDYLGASYLVLHQSDEYTISLDGTVEHVSRLITQALTERSKDEISLSHMIYFGDLGSGEFIHGRSIAPDGRVLHLDESAIESGPVFAYIPEYNRLMLTKCALGEVAPGSIVDISQKTVQRYSNSLDAFYSTEFFSGEEPIISRELVLRVEAGAQIHWADINWPSAWPKFDLSDEGQFTIFRWSLKDIPPIIAESNMPPDIKFTPSILLSISNGWEKIAADFALALDEALDNPDEINRIAGELTKKKKKPADKARSIYNWVVSEMRFIPAPSQLYSFAPKMLSIVLEKRYANDLDKTVLFYYLCKQAGVKADIGFVSKHESAFDREVPSLGFVPTPVVRLDLEGDEIWAELSSENMPLGVLPNSIMGEPAIIFREKGVEFIRVNPPKTIDEGENEYLVGKIDINGDLTAELEVVYNGSRQEEIRELKQSTSEEIRREMEKRASQVHPNAILTEWEIEGIDDLSKPISVEIEFTVPNYAITAGDKFLAFTIPNLRYSAWGTGKPSRDWPIWFDSPYRGTHDVTIGLPKGYEVYYIPNDTSSVADSLLYSAKFKTKKGKFHFFDDYDRGRFAFPPDMYPAYQDYRRVQASVASAWIVLTKN